MPGKEVSTVKRRDWLYRFPSNKRAEQLKLLEQIEYVKSEVEEARQALLMKEGDARVIEELWDAMQTIEGALRKFPRKKVVIGLSCVKLKCRHRGDYVKWEDR